MNWDKFDYLVCGIVVSVIAVMILCLFALSHEDDRLMKQCMQDHKEYECKAMLSSGTPSTTIVPVFIPSR